MNLSALQPLLQAVLGARVVCVGDLMVDRYVYGEVTRISPEAPIPVVRKTSAQTMLGGMGNVARNVAGLGGRAGVVGVVGDDPAAGEALALVGADPRAGKPSGQGHGPADHDQDPLRRLRPAAAAPGR